MGMTIAHNMKAINAYRMYSSNTKIQAKSAEKLSSGYRINRAADDAAGLSISEKMRRQIRGLNQGVKNVEDGISLLQVADGAADEIDSMLHRLEELSVQAANGTYTDEDRLCIDREAQQLLTEINRIDEVTEFNGKKVFFDPGQIVKGQTPTATSKFFQVMAGNVTTTGHMKEKMPGTELEQLNYTAANNMGNPGVEYTGVHIDFGSLIGSNKIQELAGTQFYVNCCTDCCPAVVEFVDEAGMSISTKTPSDMVDRVFKIGLKKPDGSYYRDATEFNNAIVDSFRTVCSNGHVEFAAKGDTLFIYDIDPNNWSATNEKMAYFCDTSNFYNPGTMVIGSMWIQAGANNAEGTYISTGKVNGTAIGIDPLSLKTQADASNTIGKIQSALIIVNRVRSKIGAQQNRLESTCRGNLNYSENLQNAESVIRHTDMAEEMLNSSKGKILSQSSQAMLSQANSSGNSVLDLFL